MYELLDAPEHIALKKVFSSAAALWGTLLGGPLAGGFMIAYNFQAFGRTEKIAATWVVAALVCLAAILLPNYVPILQNSSLIISVMIALASQSAVRYTQTDEMNHHLASGGELQPWWVTLLVGVLGFLVTIVIIVLVLSILDPAGFQGLMEEIQGL